MDQLDFCVKCGNTHQGSCSTEAVYFYWFPQPWEEQPQEVFIVGDWSKWGKKEKMTKVSPPKAQPYYSILLALSEGTHQYKFFVDGVWKHDKNSLTTPTTFGTLNNIVDILPKKNYMRKVPGEPLKITSNFCIENLKIMGSWDNWTTEREMAKTYNPLKKCEENVIYLDLQPGQTYQFKFRHKNQYFVDQKYPTVTNIFGTLNNIIIVYSKNITIDTPRKLSISQKHIKEDKQLKGKIFSWRKIPQKIYLPYQRVEGHSMCCVGQYLYIFGGKSRNQFYNTLLKINSTFDKLQFQQVYPDGRAFHTMKPYGNKIIVYGGNNKQVLQDYEVFNVSERKWHATPSISKVNLAKKCQKQSCVVFQTLLVFFGGCYNAQKGQIQKLSDQIQVLDLQKMQWIQSIHLEGQHPPPRFAHTAEIIHSDMFIFGGVYNLSNLNLNDLWKINLSNVNHLRWEKVQPSGTPPQPRHGHTMDHLSNLLIVFGGINDQNQLLNDISVYNSTQNEWIKPIVQGFLPKPRFNHASCSLLDNEIVIFGGKTADKGKNNEFYVLQPSGLSQSTKLFDDGDSDE